MLDDLEFKHSRFPRVLSKDLDLPEDTGQGDFDINSLYLDDIEAYDVFCDDWPLESELDFNC